MVSDSVYDASKWTDAISTTMEPGRMPDVKGSQTRGSVLHTSAPVCNPRGKWRLVGRQDTRDEVEVLELQSPREMQFKRPRAACELGARYNCREIETNRKLDGGRCRMRVEKEEDGCVLVLGINAEHVSTPPPCLFLLASNSPFGISIGGARNYWIRTWKASMHLALTGRILAEWIMMLFPWSIVHVRVSVICVGDAHLSDAVTHEFVLSTGTVTVRAPLLATKNCAPNYGLCGFPYDLCFEFEFLGISGVSPGSPCFHSNTTYLPRTTGTTVIHTAVIVLSTYRQRSAECHWHPVWNLGANENPLPLNQAHLNSSLRLRLSPKAPCSAGLRAKKESVSGLRFLFAFIVNPIFKFHFLPAGVRVPLDRKNAGI
ncbi:hypothetical protein DFH06DRAFT_1143780 [Mycena polygramma]|nr:hypothetical protein DFH06DRAFT_1143780 [Mycena polygramma]